MRSTAAGDPAGEAAGDPAGEVCTLQYLGAWMGFGPSSLFGSPNLLKGWSDAKRNLCFLHFLLFLWMMLFLFESELWHFTPGVVLGPCFYKILARTTFVLVSLPEAKNPGQDAIFGDFVFERSNS